MSIRTKILAVSIVILGLFILADNTLHRLIVGPSFRLLEQNQAREKMEHLVAAIQAEFRLLDGFLQSWMNTADIATLLETPEVHFAWEGPTDTSTQFLYIVNRRREVLKYSMYPPSETPLPQFPLDRPWPEHHPLCSHPPGAPPVTGFLSTASGPAMVMSRPFSVSSPSGSLEGAIVMGRMLYPALAARIQSRAGGIPFTLTELDISPPETGIIPQISEIAIVDRNRSYLSASALLRDVYGQPRFRLAMDIPKTVTPVGEKVTSLDATGSIVAGLTALLVLVALLRRLVIQPLSTLSGHMEAIASSGSLTKVQYGKGQDEIAVLAESFNTMIDRLVIDGEKRARAEEELAEKKRLAELGELGASVAHEIRNPLAGISGALQVIRNSAAPDSPQYEAIEESLDQIARVERTVQQLLLYAKPWQPTVRRIELRSFIQGLIEGKSRDTQESSCPIVLEEGSAVTVQCDAELMEQVLVNLIQNAGESMPGSGTITIQLRSRQDAVEIAVLDEGRGFDADHLEQVFEPFFTTRTRGTGLGLAICRRIIEAHGGSITARNRQAGGAEIVVRLPLDGG